MTLKPQSGSPGKGWKQMRAESFKEMAVIDFGRNMAPYHAAAGELIRLARELPGGLELLKSFQAKHRDQGFIDWREEVVNGALVLVALPSSAVTDLIIDLRHRAHAPECAE